MLRSGYSNKKDLLSAYKELITSLDTEHARIILLFLSSSYAKQLSTTSLPLNDESIVVACTTSGEISPEFGITSGSIVGLSFAKEHFLTEVFEFSDLSNLDPEGSFPDRFMTALQSHRRKKPNAKSFAILLIDGLSTKEEIVVDYLSGVLKEIPLIGASAGDDNKLEKTSVLVSGQFRSNAAVLLLISTEEMFEIFKTDHFLPGDQNLVITSANPQRRTVHEIDGIPASIAYANALGVKADDLDISLFWANPLLLKLGEDHYVRSIQQILDDGSLVFHCAIDEGVVLKVAKKKDLLTEMRHFFTSIEKKMGSEKYCLFFECTGRRYEIEQSTAEYQKAINDLYRNNNVVGFHTYGEQFCGLHINQTLTGVAFGKRRRSA